MNKSFPKCRRLLKTWEFQRAWKMGCKLHTPHFILLCAKSNTNQSRLGMTVSKKVGNAVARNQVKRLVREYYRVNYQRFTEPIDFSVIAKKGAASLSLRQISAELDRIFS